MQQQPQNDKRRYPRHERELKLFYHYTYEMDTRVEYQIVDKYQKPKADEKHPAQSKNISVDGIGIIADERLKRGDFLNLDIYLPEVSQPVHMAGEVMWSQRTMDAASQAVHFVTGIHIREVEGKPVEASIYYDEQYHVEWSAVLESVLGKYRIISQQRHQDNKN